jgi:tape measure domain-containing protein
MKNIVEWLIQFKANPQSFQVAARRVESGLDRIGRKADRVGTKIAGAFSGSNFKSALQNIPVIGSLMNPYLAAITGIGAGLTAIVWVGSEVEKTAIAFNTLVGNEQKAAAMLKEIRTFANYTPYKTMDLVNSSKMMLSFGVSTDTTVEKLKQLGDIAQGDANILKSLSLVYGQVSSLGYMQGQDWHQFINAGFNPLEELSQMTGKKMPELQEMMSKGQIGVKAINAAIEHATSEGGKFYEMTKKQAESVQGRWSTLVGIFENSLAELFEQIKPAINWLIEVVPPYLEMTKNAVSSIINWLKTFGEKYPAFLDMLKETWKFVKEFIKQTGSFFVWLTKKVVSIAEKLAKLLGFGSDEGQKQKSTVTKAKENKQAVEKAKPKTPKQYNNLFEKAKSGKGTSGKDANAIATGGTRNTTINMTIGKFFDTMQVTMMDATDTTELETIVVQSLNRALAIATSTDR